MTNQIFLYIGSALTIIWGVAHLFPTKSVVTGFGDITTDNRRIITMEWIIEGVSLIFIGLLCAGLTIIDYTSIISQYVFIFSSVFLIVLAIISLFTGFRVNFVPYKLCPIIFSLSAILILTGALLGCKTMNEINQKNMSENYYFSSPAEAVEIINELLDKKNFKILAKYYDLSNSEIKLSELESGDFFIRKERPGTAHPAGFWRYKHPFAPGFTFNNVKATAKSAIYRVEVSISIDQGSNSPKQIGLSYFYMLKSDKGWKVLPDQVDTDEYHTETPSFIQ
jgi:hypothetical protein